MTGGMMKWGKYFMFLRYVFVVFLMLSFLSSCSHSRGRVTQVREITDQVYFAFDKDQTSYQSLESVLTHLQQHPESRVMLEGYADPIGSENYNDDLGDRRSRGVKSWLIKNGISESRISSVSFGEKKVDESGSRRFSKRRVVMVKVY
jgi:outer membrane protein OmpA-like peptidoglycan-associated protein